MNLCGLVKLNLLTSKINSNSIFGRYLSGLPPGIRSKKYYELTVDEDDIDRTPNPLADVEHRINESKKRMQWRPQIIKKQSLIGEALSMFSSKRKQAARMRMVTRPLEFWTWKSYKEAAEKRRIGLEALMQSYIPERHQILKNDLAAAHFIVFRGGEVRFTHSDVWYKKAEDDSYDLPSKYDPQWLVEAIKCDNMDLYYEGLQNIRRLHSLKSISLRNVKQFDDWCLDRLCGNQFENLETLDITNTNITANGLVAITKLRPLKLLILNDLKRSQTFELSLLMLQENLPNLVIRESDPDVTTEKSVK